MLGPFPYFILRGQDPFYFFRVDFKVAKHFIGPASCLYYPARSSKFKMVPEPGELSVESLMGSL